MPDPGGGVGPGAGAGFWPGPYGTGVPGPADPVEPGAAANAGSREAGDPARTGAVAAGSPELTVPRGVAATTAVALDVVPTVVVGTGAGVAAGEARTAQTPVDLGGAAGTPDDGT